MADATFTAPVGWSQWTSNEKINDPRSKCKIATAAILAIVSVGLIIFGSLNFKGYIRIKLPRPASIAFISGGVICTIVATILFPWKTQRERLKIDIYNDGVNPQYWNIHLYFPANASTSYLREISAKAFPADAPIPPDNAYVEEEDALFMGRVLSQGRTGSSAAILRRGPEDDSPLPPTGVTTFCEYGRGLHADGHLLIDRKKRIIHYENLDNAFKNGFFTESPQYWNRCDKRGLAESEYGE